jgi:hypothetical protein
MDKLARWATAVQAWWPALTAVPRHRFVPDTIWVPNPEPWPTLVPVHRDDDPDRWLQLTYAHDEPVVTQVDDGQPAGPGLAWAMQTSSASAPDIVAIMLAALDAQPGERVLEIGTGTGYNAALLVHRLGAGQVTSIEIGQRVPHCQWRYWSYDEQEGMGVFWLLDPIRAGRTRNDGGSPSPPTVSGSNCAEPRSCSVTEGCTSPVCCKLYACRS